VTVPLMSEPKRGATMMASFVPSPLKSAKPSTSPKRLLASSSWKHAEALETEDEPPILTLLSSMR